jgi:hydroxypyruvate isomerase
MGDKNVFNQSTIGAVGSNATASNNTFQQVNYSFPENFDYEKLSEQLTILRDNLVRNAKTPDEFKAIGDVAAAELASKEKDGNKVVKHLKDAGKWVFDTATKIGVSVVSEIIKQQM